MSDLKKYADEIKEANERYERAKEYLRSLIDEILEREFGDLDFHGLEMVEGRLGILQSEKLREEPIERMNKKLNEVPS